MSDPVNTPEHRLVAVELLLMQLFADHYTPEQLVALRGRNAEERGLYPPPMMPNLSQGDRPYGVQISIELILNRAQLMANKRLGTGPG